MEVKRTLALAIILVLLCVFAPEAQAQCKCDHTIAPATWLFDGAVAGVKPGDIVCFQKGTRKNIEIYNINGTLTNPVIITNACDGKTIIAGSKTTTTPFAVNIYKSSHFRFTGSRDDKEGEYGIELTGTHMGLDIRGLSTNFLVDHVYVHDITSVAFVGKTDPTCDPTTWFGNFIMRDAVFRNNLVNASGDEAFYIGNSHYTSGVTKTCNGVPLKVFEHEVIGVDIHHNIVLNPGRDGIQVGSTTSKCYIHDNLVENWATKAIYAHQSGIQINQGTVANIYRNKLHKGTGYGIFVSGSGGTRVVNNVVSDALQGGIFANDFAPIYPNVSYVFMNNTLVNNRDYGIYMLSEKTVNNVFSNNIIVAPFPVQSTFLYVKLNNPSKISWKENNNIKTADLASLKFESPSTNNFKLLPTSPAIDQGFDLSASPLSVVDDVDGNARPVNSKFDVGAHELQSAAPKANAGPDQTLTLPTNTTILNGSGTGGTMTYLWTKKSGGAATLVNATTPSLTLSDLVEGTYVFQLQVTDANGFGLDEVSVIVLPLGTNLQPTVNAGTDQAITLPVNTATFTAVGTDTDGSIAGYAWIQKSGPNSATLTNQTTSALTAANLVAGTYEFEVTVTDDKGGIGIDVVRVVVGAAAANVLPKVNAGTDKVLNLPTNSIVLTGVVTDSDGTIATLLWEKKSGPGAALANASTLSLTATTLVQGSYVFRLTATDNSGGSAFDEVKVDVVAGNQNPTASAGTDKVITLPTNTINITGTGNDPDGSITTYAWSKVSGGAASVTNAGQATVTLSGLVAGVYIMGLTVTDNTGATGYDEVKVTVNAAGNVAPTANAGTDKTITLPTNTLTLNGSGLDSDGSIASYQWTKKSGPVASMANANTKDLGLSNLLAGIYTFTLRVTDNSSAFADDDVIVTVLPAAINQSPVANAGGNKYLTLPTSSVSLVGAGSDPDGTIATYSWTKDQGPAGGTLTNANTSTLNLTNLVEGEYLFNLTVTDNKGATASDFATVIVSSGNLPPLVEAGPNQTLVLPTDATTLPATVSDPDGTIASYAWTQVSGPVTTATGGSTATLSLTALIQGTYVFSLEATDDDGDKTSDAVTVSVLPNSTNVVPVVSAGSDQILFLPTNSVVLNGNATDADGTITTYLWTQQSGTPVTMINTNISALTATSLPQGTFVFRLTATDNDGTSAFDEVTVTVNPGTQNQPPLVSAGPNQIILLPNSIATFAGSATDNDGSISTYTWTKTSGPTATLQNATTSNLNVTGLLEGTYVFRLTVRDNGGATAFAEARVIVFPTTLNQAPTADAGQNQTIVLPINSTSLVGAGSDPDGTILTYAWNKISGPVSFSIVSPGSPITSLTNLVLGTYVFRLSVTDDAGVTGSDDITITVNDAATNRPPIADAGGNQSITLPTNAANLFGSGSDSDGTVVSYLWIKTSGGTASLANPSSPTLTVTNLQAGTYKFRLRVTDDDGVTNDDVATILVNSAATNQPPIANAGLDKVLILPVNSTLINGNGADQDGSITSYLWEKRVGGTVALTNTAAKDLQLNGLQDGAYVFRLTVTDNSGYTDFDEMSLRVLPSTSNSPPVVEIGNDTTLFLPTSSIALSPSAEDNDGTVDVYFWTKVSGPAATIVDPNVQDVQINNLIQGVYTFRLSAIDNQNTSTSDQIKITVLPGGINQSPVVDAGTDKTITLPTNSITLTGTASDIDGTITLEWTQLSGGAASLAGQTTTDLALSNLVAGNYEFELKATDNDGSSATDRVVVRVNPVPPNQPPQVSAGDNAAVVLPATNISFNGSATDSDGTVVSYLWTKQSGPTVTLQDTTTPTLTVTDLVPGFYIFRLSAKDNSNNTGFDEAILVVSEVPAATNQPPVVYAGPDTSFVSPMTSIVSVFGEAVDLDGGTIAEYQWTQTSGTPVTFEASTSILTFQDIPVGVYEFTLTASDEDGNSASDAMILTVVNKETSDLANFIPKYFSPNNDGFNDKWEFGNTEVVKDCNLFVYTREGKLVYEALSYDNSWDGSTDNGRKLSNGDYYYVIKFNGNILIAGGVRIIQ